MATSAILERNGSAGYAPAANVLGVKIDAINMDRAVQIVDAALTNGQRGYICVTGVHGVMEAQSDPHFKAVLNSSLLTTPDGMPTVWVGKIQGHNEMARVYGPDFMSSVCELSVTKGYRHFLYGGRDGVAGQLKESLEQRFPGIQIVGTYTPPFRQLNATEESELAQLVADSKPDILWVGLSTPKQERFMAKYDNKLDVPVMVGVGAAFDLHTGSMVDAPGWMKASGLQWFHRLCQEPKRLWKRYLINNPKFVAKITLQLLGLKNYDLVVPRAS